MRAIGTVCEVCEKPTAEPIIHEDTGDSFCGSCALSMIAGERDLYRDTLDLIAREGRGWARRKAQAVLAALGEENE